MVLSRLIPISIIGATRFYTTLVNILSAWHQSSLGPPSNQSPSLIRHDWLLVECVFRNSPRRTLCISKELLLKIPRWLLEYTAKVTIGNSCFVVISRSLWYHYPLHVPGLLWRAHFESRFWWHWFDSRIHFCYWFIHYITERRKEVHKRADRVVYDIWMWRWRTSAEICETNNSLSMNTPPMELWDRETASSWTACYHPEGERHWQLIRWKEWEGWIKSQTIRSKNQLVQNHNKRRMNANHSYWNHLHASIAFLFELQSFKP